MGAELRDELRRRLNKAGGFRLEPVPDVLEKRPNVALAGLGGDQVEAVLAVFDWVVERIDVAARSAPE